MKIFISETVVSNSNEVREYLSGYVDMIEVVDIDNGEYFLNILPDVKLSEIENDLIILQDKYHYEYKLEFEGGEIVIDIL